MIWLGMDPVIKQEIIRDYMAQHGLRKAFVLSPRRFAISGWDREMTDPEAECNGCEGLFVEWSNITFYRYYYRLLQQIDHDTLVVVNEGLRSRDRHSLPYNCVRAFLQQTHHVLVFSTLPIIEDMDDAMILIDWDTRSKWRRDPFDVAMLREVKVQGVCLSPVFEPVAVPVNDETLAAYSRERERLFAAVEADPSKDPHQIPRQLHLLSGKAKADFLKRLPLAQSATLYPVLVRNDRLKIPGSTTYQLLDTRQGHNILEWPHAFVEFADALAVNRGTSFRVLVADTKADAWYMDRYNRWTERVAHAASTLLG